MEAPTAIPGKPGQAPPLDAEMPAASARETTREQVARSDAPFFEVDDAGASSDGTWIAFALLAALALGLRLYDLGSRAIHHDESLHAVYSWYLYIGRGYTHDPMMHGPFLFHATALMYWLFGDSEVTARLPEALLGSAVVVLPFFLRHELGKVGAIAAGALLALGPTYVYFSRFAREDATVVFHTLLLVVGIWGWIRTRRGPYLYAGSVGLALLFSNKEVSFMHAFIFTTFLVTAMLVERLRGGPRTITDGLAAISWRQWAGTAGLFLGISVVLYTTFFTNMDGLCTALVSPHIGSCATKLGALEYWLGQHEVARGGQPWFYYLMLITLYEILPLSLAWLAVAVSVRRLTAFVAFCVWWALLALLIYSWAGEKMPWLIVHPLLPLVLLAGVAVEFVSHHLRRPWGLTSRQWGVVGLMALAGAAFVAWITLGTPASAPVDAQAQVLRRVPLALVIAGLLSGAAWVARDLRRGQVLGSAGALLGLILVLYTIRTGWQVNYKNGDNPVEMLVYVQSAPDVPFVVSELERLGNQLGLRKDVPILLDGGYTDTVAGQSVPHEAISWPFEWYLRDFKAKQYFSRNLPADFSSGPYAAVLVMGTNLDPIKDQLTGYTGNKFKLNWWYPEDYKQITWETLLPGNWDAGKVMKYVLYRELVNAPAPPASPLGARDFYFYVRNDLVGAGGATAGAGNPVVAARPPVPAAQELRVDAVTSLGRVNGVAELKDPKGIAVDGAGRVYVVDGTNATVTVFNRDGSVARSWGRKGAGNGEFTEPWGIAVAPDGSVFVADTWNHRVQKFDAEGRFIATWGRFVDVGSQVGASPGAFFGPRDIAITTDGKVLVMDTGNERIQVFEQDGRYLRMFGGEGRGVGQFREPVGLALDRTGNIYVADTWNQRIQVFSSEFEPVTQYAVPQWSSIAATHKPYLAVGGDGSIYATAPERGGLLRMRDGVVTALTPSQGPKLALPVGIRVAADGLYVSDAQSGVVIVYQLGRDEPAPPAASSPEAESPS